MNAQAMPIPDKAKHLEEAMSSGIVIPESGEIEIPSYGVLGVRVHTLQVPDILRVLDHWIKDRKRVHCACSTGMHGASVALEDHKFRDTLNRMDLNCMDGVPMRTLGQIHGFKYVKRRSAGPEVMAAVFSQTGAKYKHFFYGNRVSEHSPGCVRKNMGCEWQVFTPRHRGPCPRSKKKTLPGRSSRRRPTSYGAAWAPCGKRNGWTNSAIGLRYRFCTASVPALTSTLVIWTERPSGCAKQGLNGLIA